MRHSYLKHQTSGGPGARVGSADGAREQDMHLIDESVLQREGGGAQRGSALLPGDVGHYISEIVLARLSRASFRHFVRAHPACRYICAVRRHRLQTAPDFTQREKAPARARQKLFSPPDPPAGHKVGFPVTNPYGPQRTPPATKRSAWLRNRRAPCWALGQGARLALQRLVAFKQVVERIAAVVARERGRGAR